MDLGAAGAAVRELLQPWPLRAHLNGVTVASLLLISLAGFAWPELGAADPIPPKDVTGKQWILTELHGDSVDQTIRSTLSVAPDSRASGTTGCNRWFGTASFEGSSLTFSGVATTRMACAKPAMDREASFTRMIGLVRSWKLIRNELSLAGEDGVVLAVFRPEPPGAGRK